MFGSILVTISISTVVPVELWVVWIVDELAVTVLIVSVSLTVFVPAKKIHRIVIRHTSLHKMECIRYKNKSVMNWPSWVDEVDCWVLVCAVGKELGWMEEVWLVLISMLVTISVSPIVSIVLCDVTVVDEVFEVVVVIIDVSIVQNKEQS